MKAANSSRARHLRALAVFVLVAGSLVGGLRLRAGVAAQASPVLVVETSKGSFSIETFPAEAPLTVAHIVELVKSGFYDGQRVHRAIPGFLVQFGDPQTRDLAKQSLWGRGAGAASGKPVGVAEITPKRTHKKGAVGLAHQGLPAKGDSQIYVTLAPRPDLDGQYAVFGQVVEGAEIPAGLQVGDAITRMYVRP